MINVFLNVVIILLVFVRDNSIQMCHNLFNKLIISGNVIPVIAVEYWLINILNFTIVLIEDFILFWSYTQTIYEIYLKF